MRRRITTAIVGVTAFVLLALGIPLAVVAQRQIISKEVNELQVSAAETLTEIEVPLDVAQLEQVAVEPDAPPSFSVYDAEGRLVFGTGSPTADPVVLAALAGTPQSSTEDDIVVVTPITDANENVVGALHMSESRAGAEAQARRAWLLMALSAVVALGLAWFIGYRLAKGLSQPVNDLAASAAKLGHGGTLERHEPVGITEIDQLGEALVHSSVQINESLAREQRFSADVSHQLRTPLAGLRLKLEAGQPTGLGPEATGSALEDLDRIDVTVAHLLDLARGAVPATSTCSLGTAVRAAEERWSPRAHVLSRVLIVTDAPDAIADAAGPSVDQVLDVLIDNALTHGEGTVTIDVRSIPGGVAVDVADEGSLPTSMSEAELFRRGHGTNNGIGLALARSIAEAEGGRLLVLRRNPTTFTLVHLTPSR